jgi:hypothetical protein
MQPAYFCNLEFGTYRCGTVENAHDNIKQMSILFGGLYGHD